MVDKNMQIEENIKPTSRAVKVGNLYVGGNNKITVQSMLNTKLSYIESSINQVQLLELNGCDIIRASIDTEEDAKAIAIVKKYTEMPVVADIQFDYRMALHAIKNGADAIRINPCYIGSEANVTSVINECKENNIPIRVGVNSGSVKKEFLDKYNGVNKYSLVESALEQVAIVEKYNYENDAKIDSFRAFIDPMKIDYAITSQNINDHRRIMMRHILFIQMITAISCGIVRLL